jgi:hypothetical protein
MLTHMNVYTQFSRFLERSTMVMFFCVKTLSMKVLVHISINEYHSASFGM